MRWRSLRGPLVEALIQAPVKRGRQLLKGAHPPMAGLGQPGPDPLAIKVQARDSGLQPLVLGFADAALQRCRLSRSSRSTLRRTLARVSGRFFQVLPMSHILQILSEYLGEPRQAQGRIDMRTLGRHLEALVQVAAVLLEAASSHTIGNDIPAAIVNLAAQDDVYQIHAMQGGLLVVAQRGVMHRDAEHAADFLGTGLPQAGLAGPAAGSNAAIVDALHQRPAHPLHQGPAVMAATIQAGTE